MKTRTCCGPDIRTFVQDVDEAIASGVRPTLAIVFCAPTFDLNEIGQLLGRRGMAVVGASTAGEIVNGSVREDSCVALLMDADPAAFDIQLCSMPQDGTMFELG